MENAKISRIFMLLLLVTRNKPVKSSCSNIIRVNYEYEYELQCHGELKCIGDFTDAMDRVRIWNCIRQEYYDPSIYSSYYYSRRANRVRLRDNYTLEVYGEKFEYSTDYMFRDIVTLSDHITVISVTNGHITEIPTEIISLPRATKIDLSKNSIKSLTLKGFARTNSEVLNISFNAIFKLETVQRSSTSENNQLITLDLSHNAVQAIPDNYFGAFLQLQHLNLSYNSIESITNFTFEGLGQLKTLYLSSNKISYIGQYLSNFVYLKELMLDQNYLTSLGSSDFINLVSLETLNVSCNLITNVNVSSFDHLTDLMIMDMSYNKLTNIKRDWFYRNSKLMALDLSNNIIQNIEPGAFQNTSITEFKILNNKLTGTLGKATFQGIDTENLDLSGGLISQLGPYLFNNNIQILNLSHNSIFKISKTTFQELKLLNTLDLSHNILQDVEFDVTNLKNLSSLYINNNSLKKITRLTFKNLTTLKTIQLSNNDIEDIDEQSFVDLFELESLVLSNNPLPTVIAPSIFNGLPSCMDIDLTYTKVTRLCNNSFNGMNSLNTFNISYGDLKDLEYEVFNNTDFINNLDFSHNQIEMFFINTSNIKLVTTVDFSYNKLVHVTEKTFSGLEKLLFLNLDHNNILRIETDAFRTLNNLVNLNLSYNRDMTFNSSVFYNIMTLQSLSLGNVLQPFHLENAINTSITYLDVSFCGITDIYLVLMNKIETIERLQLSANKIRSIDKFSFENLHRLSWVDLSYNMISNIQPSSFSQCENLIAMNLSNNFITSLQFGVFDGLTSLQTLDLSKNTLHSLRANIFHNVTTVDTLYLDNNLIDDIDLREFSVNRLSKISIGGNKVPCSALIEFKNNRFRGFTVTAKIRKYDEENVNGITCISSTKLLNSSGIRGNDTVLTEALMKTIEEFKVTVERILSRNESKIGLDMTGLKSIPTSIEHLEEAFSKSEKANGVLIDELMTLINEWNSYNVNNKISQSAAGVNGATDIKSALYLVAASFATLVFVAVGILLFYYLRFRRGGHQISLYSSSRQNISNAMEME